MPHDHNEPPRRLERRQEEREMRSIYSFSDALRIALDRGGGTAHSAAIRHVRWSEGTCVRWSAEQRCWEHGGPSWYPLGDRPDGTETSGAICGVGMFTPLYLADDSWEVLP